MLSRLFGSRAMVASAGGALCTCRRSVQAGRKYDLFGYEVETNTAPWIEKILKAKYYDEAGDTLVEMNLHNCPPDLDAYNATLKKIFECPSKGAEPMENESKFCAMMDLLEEMNHRNKIKPNEESWLWVMNECVASGNYRMGFVIERVLKEQFSGCPPDLVAQNDANGKKAVETGKEHPVHLAKQSGLFESVTQDTK